MGALPGIGMGATTLTLEKIGDLAGVSRSTVSRVINGDANVRELVRERVWQVIQETGYQPHAAARSLVTHRTQIIGVIIPEALTRLFADPFFPLLLAGVTGTCNVHNYHLLLSLFNGPADSKEMYRRVVRSGHLDGVIVASSRIDDPLVPQLLEDGFPFVLVGRHPDQRVNYVDTDNVGAALMAVEHLIRLGHRRIATITGPLATAHGQDRLAGYRSALEAHGIPLRQDLIAEGDFSEASGSSGALHLLAASPTAIFVASDTMAIGALKALRQASHRIPEDVALVGFDDVPIASAVEPALTTIRQPISRLGSLAAELVLNMAENPSGEQASVQRIVLPAELVVRKSCGSV